jgi:hypothetical protein
MQVHLARLHAHINHIRFITVYFETVCSLAEIRAREESEQLKELVQRLEAERDYERGLRISAEKEVEESRLNLRISHEIANEAEERFSRLREVYKLRHSS